MGRRITRKQLKQDEFVTVGGTVMEWLGDNWRPIVVIAGAALVVYAIWGVASWWSQDKALEAAQQLGVAMDAMAMDGESGEEDVDVQGQLHQVVDQHSGTVQADIARLFLARMLLEQGKQDEARELLVRVISKNEDTTLGRFAAYDLLQLRIASGQAAEVAAELEASSAGEDTSLPRDVALYELGMLAMRQGQEDKAKEYLNTLVEEMPESPYLYPARQRLAELG